MILARSFPPEVLAEKLVQEPGSMQNHFLGGRTPTAQQDQDINNEVLELKPGGFGAKPPEISSTSHASNPQAPGKFTEDVEKRLLQSVNNLSQNPEVPCRPFILAVPRMEMDAFAPFPLETPCTKCLPDHLCDLSFAWTGKGHRVCSCY